jgi:hypothetical protein
MAEITGEWDAFIGLASPEGKAWVAGYRRDFADPFEEAFRRALQWVRGGSAEQACSLLRRLELDLPEASSNSMAAVVVLRFFAAYAYGEYARGEFDSAEAYLGRAQCSVAAAVEKYPHLLPLATRCSEFRIHSVRISRNRQRWREVGERIETVRRTLRDELPLCRLSNGQSVGFATLLALFEGGSGVTAEEKQWVNDVLGPAARLAQFERIVPSLAWPSGFVIPYP